MQGLDSHSRDEECLIRPGSEAAFRNAVQLLKDLPAAEALPYHLFKFMEAEREAQESEEGAVVDEEPESEEARYSRLLRHSVNHVPGGTLAGRTAYNPDVVTPQIIRATGSFHGRPWYDSVEVASLDDEDALQFEYAQLQMVFTAKLDGGSAARQLALVRYYAEDDGQDVLTEFGSKRLKWLKRPQLHIRERAPGMGYCAVVGLDSISSRAYIVKDFSNASGKLFHWSNHKLTKLTLVHKVYPPRIVTSQ